MCVVGFEGLYIFLFFLGGSYTCPRTWVPTRSTGATTCGLSSAINTHTHTHAHTSYMQPPPLQVMLTQVEGLVDMCIKGLQDPTAKVSA